MNMESDFEYSCLKAEVNLTPDPNFYFKNLAT